jgi:ABC-2 type transport system ATP-binding protein
MTGTSRAGGVGDDGSDGRDGAVAAGADRDHGDVDDDGDGPARRALSATDVRKTYGDVRALDGVDLAVDRGEVFGLIGPNGAGKTTLVRGFTGTTDVEGTVELLGADPTDADPERIGLLPQSFDPPARLTARELLEYYAGLYAEARSVDSVLADVGLSDDADAWYETLSGGQKRRVCVGTALVNDPEVLFLDEPTTGIDPAGRRDVHRLVRDLAAGGTTVLVTSHAMDEIERLADRVGLIREGRIVAVGTPSELIAQHGGEPTLSVRLSDGAAADGAETALRAVTSRTRFSAARGRDGASVGKTADLVVSGVEPASIDAVVEALSAAGVEVESLSWSEPTLEDVYLELTGETYRPTAREMAESGGDR